MTEKQYSPTKTEKKAMAAQPKKVDAPTSAPKVEEKKTETPVEAKTEEKAPEKKKENKKPVVKKDHAVVNARSVHVSTKYAIAMCKFIKNKTIENAIADLEQVLAKKKHIPMVGEYGHKKGQGKVASGAGKYPQAATKEFIVLLKSLQGNSNANGLDNPVVSEAMANHAPTPMGRFGRWQRKRTHIRLVARDKKENNKKKEKKK